MAGAITIVDETLGPIKKVTFTWTSDSSGDATVTASDKYYTGEIIKVLIVPSVTGGLVPTANYTARLTDADGYDLLCGQTTLCLPASGNTVITGGMLPVTHSKISLVVAASGDVTSGIVQVYIR